MCGLVAAQLTEARLSDERVDRVLAGLAHRGPDARHRWFSTDRCTMLGHVRLSVIGVRNGDQPLRNEAGDVHCVVNGELYGYRRIRAELRAEGRSCATDSDSEVALLLYEKFGGDFVHRLRGAARSCCSARSACTGSGRILAAA